MAICNSFLNEKDDALVEASLNGENSGIESCPPEIRAQIEKDIPAVREALEQRIEEMAEVRIEKHIQEGSEKVPDEELTPEKAKSLFTKEYNEWPQEVRSQIPAYRLFPEEMKTKEGKIMGFLMTDKATGRGGVGIPLTQTVTEAKRNITHEFVEMDYKLMPQSEKTQLEDTFTATSNQDNIEKEIEFFNQWGKGYERYAVYGESAATSQPKFDAKENYCFWMTAFKHESHERLKELKEINPEKFNFCKERHKAYQIKVRIEQLREGGLISF